jgi:hypothetical protein
MVKTAQAQEAESKIGKQTITSSQPKVMGTAEEQMPAEKKPGSGKYLLYGLLGVALVALAAGGAGGGGGGTSSTPTSDSGSVAVGW